MAFDFPSSPAEGQLYSPAGGPNYVFTNGVWKNVSGSSGVATGDAPPATPYPGQLWWESDTGTLYAWYVDANSSQWVQVGAPVTAGLPPGVYKLSSGVFTVPQAALNVPFPAGYTQYELIVSGILPATNGQALVLQMSADGVTYDSGNNYAYGSNVSIMSGTPVNTPQGGSGTTYIVLFAVQTNGARSPINIRFSAAPGGVPYVNWDGVYNNGTSYYTINGGGINSFLTSPIGGCRLLYGAGNVDRAAWQLNGVR